MSFGEVMTAARSTKIDLNATPFYHCVSRCVRRSYLYGIDEATGQDFSHRKGWIVNRIKQLSAIFAIKICAYAVMSNHYHLVVFINQKEAKSWNDDEIIKRWSALYPLDASKFKDEERNSNKMILKLNQWREHLADISWFMRCMNETIARWSNQEDNCTGRFWEGRFKSQALLDEGAVLAAMAYVDLNPIRAKVALTPETSEFTSIFERIHHLKSAVKKNENKNTHVDGVKQPGNLMWFSNGNNANKFSVPTIAFKLSDYLELVDTTGRILREDKKGAIPESVSPILHRLNLSSKGWMNLVRNLEGNFFTGIGHESILAQFRSQHRKRGPRGIRAAKQCYLQAA